MNQETSMGAALKAAVKTLSRKKQTEMIAEYIYKKFAVIKQFKPLAIGIDQDLIKSLDQYESDLILRVLSNHCRRPRYIKALARGGKRFDLNNRFKGEVTAEEQQIALQHPCMQQNNPEKTQQATNIVAREETIKAVSEDHVVPVEDHVVAVNDSITQEPKEHLTATNELTDPEE